MKIQLMMILLLISPALQNSSSSHNTDMGGTKYLSTLEIGENSKEYLVINDLATSDALSFWVDFQSNASVGLRLILKTSRDIILGNRGEVILDELYLDVGELFRYSGSKKLSTTPISLFLEIYSITRTEVSASAQVRWSSYPLLTNGEVPTYIFPELPLVKFRTLFKEVYRSEWDLLLSLDKLESTLVDVNLELRTDLTESKSKLSVAVNKNKRNFDLEDLEVLPVTIPSSRLKEVTKISVESDTNGSVSISSLSFIFREEPKNFLEFIPELSNFNIAITIIIVTWGIYFSRYRRIKV